MELWHIWKVYPHPTANPAVRRFEIHAARTVDPFRRRFLSTISELRASACDRARELRQPIGLTIAQTPYGEEITSVDLAPPPEARGQVIEAAEFFERR